MGNAQLTSTRSSAATGRKIRLQNLDNQMQKLGMSAYLRKPPMAGAMTEPKPYMTQKVAKAAGCCSLVQDSPKYVLLMPALELSNPLSTLNCQLKD
jgi:hypothetical protein